MREDNQANIDKQEIGRFSAMAEHWWDPKGELRALHDINPVRLAYISERAGLAGKKVLDVGCGGGLLAEAMAAAGARVIGIDMAEKALQVAADHAAAGLSIDYRRSSAEQWVQDHAQAYEIVTCMELVEHVPDPRSLVQACSSLTAAGGHVFFATVNRTWLARLLVIWASENILGLVAKGTHHYEKFVRPDQLIAWGSRAGLSLVDLSGLRYIPFFKKIALCQDLRMNYLVHFRKNA